MNTHFDAHFQKNIVTIHPGEFYSSNEDIFIATVLGSCISIALFDSKNLLGGINHFMLPCSSESSKLAQEDLGRYGNFAIELLINDMLKKGAKRENLQAKIFGGSNVLETNGYYPNMTGFNNISFALNYLQTENIPILANDTGGIFPRKIYFHPLTSKVLLSRVQKSAMTLEEIKRREALYHESLKTIQNKAGDITWF